MERIFSWPIMEKNNFSCTTKQHKKEETMKARNEWKRLRLKEYLLYRKGKRTGLLLFNDGTAKIEL